ncbi:MAG: hypothetical protein RDV48_24495 [Candidatus Eremiobacteraeota bacterium]|nr:hypothetical protein [Candidatus Eremiobacteraeota bacterium]
MKKRNSRAACPAILADDYKKSLGLSQEEYALYDRARGGLLVTEAQGIAALPEKALASLSLKRLVTRSRAPDGQQLFWAADPVALLEEGRLAALGTPVKILEAVSPFQKIEIHGHRLFSYFKLNGNIQFHSGEYALCRYPKAGLPAELLQKPARALILGGGDGLIAGDLLPYNPREVIIVELDGLLTEIFRHSEQGRRISQGALEAKKVKVVTDDAFSFLRGHRGSYDLVFADMELHWTRRARGDSLGRDYIGMLSMMGALLADGGIFVAMPAMDEREARFFQREILPLLEEYGPRERRPGQRERCDWHYFLFRQFFPSVKRMMLKMFFTGGHLLYLCSFSPIDEKKIRRLLKARMAAGRLRLGRPGSFEPRVFYCQDH